MIDHITLRVENIEATKTFYARLLGAIGYDTERIYDVVHGDVRVIGFSKDGKYDTWFTTDRPLSSAVHVAWRVDSRARVDAFHGAALDAGGKDNGAPGGRPHYHPNYYGAFILDPNGHNIEAVCHD